MMLTCERWQVSELCFSFGKSIVFLTKLIRSVMRWNTTKWMLTYFETYDLKTSMAKKIIEQNQTQLDVLVRLTRF